MHVWALGLHTTAREPKRAHFEGLGAHQKFHEKTSKRGKKERKIVAGEAKNAKFWAPHPSGPPEGPHLTGPPFRAHFSGFNPLPWPHRSGMFLGSPPPSPFGALSLRAPTQSTSHPNRPPHPSLKTKLWCWPIFVLAKVGNA